jgi:hypothetical protein
VSVEPTEAILVSEQYVRLWDPAWQIMHYICRLCESRAAVYMPQLFGAERIYAFLNAHLAEHGVGTEDLLAWRGAVEEYEQGLGGETAR